MTSLLVRTDEGVVTVDRCWYTGPYTLAVVAVLDKTLAAGKGIVHSLALALIKDSWITTLTTSHRSVVLVLGQSIGETVSNKNGLEVDVALLVCKNLGGENWDIVTSV